MASHIDPDNLGFLITDASRLIRAEADRRIGIAGLTVTQSEARALAHIARAGAVRQAVLAERMGIEAMTVSGLVDRLEIQGLVRRQPDPNDRRAKIVAPTSKAQTPLLAIEGIADAIFTDLARGFEAEEWTVLETLLRRLRDQLVELRVERDEEG